LVQVKTAANLLRSDLTEEISKTESKRGTLITELEEVKTAVNQAGTAIDDEKLSNKLLISMQRVNDLEATLATLIGALQNAGDVAAVAKAAKDAISAVPPTKALKAVPSAPVAVIPAAP